MKRVLIHVGYPKAASTTLQNGLFNKLHKMNQINFLGRAWESGNYCGFDRLEDYKVWLKDVIESSSFTSKDFKPNIHQEKVFPEISDDKVNVYSEGLFLTNEDHEDEIKMPMVLRDIFSIDTYDTEVLIVIRSQIKLLMSYYVQNYAKIKQKTFRMFFNKCVDENWSGRYKIFNYYNIIEKYAEFFGKDKINIMLFEDMVNDLTTFCKSFSEIINVKSNLIFELLSVAHFNKTKERGGTKVVRKIDPASIRGIAKILINKIFSNMRDIGNINIPTLTDEEEEMIIEEFRDSNMKLAEKYLLNKAAMKSYRYF